MRGRSIFKPWHLLWLPLAVAFPPLLVVIIVDILGEVGTNSRDHLWWAVEEPLGGRW